MLIGAGADRWRRGASSALQDLLSARTAHNPQIAAQIGGKAGVNEGLSQAANAFAHTYWVAFALVGLTIVAALFLPRRHEELHLLGDEESEVAPVTVH